MDVFKFRNNVINDYKNYVRSFLMIKDERINTFVDNEMNEGLLWPDPLIQLNPCFEPGGLMDELINTNMLHPQCRDIFCEKSTGSPIGEPFRFHNHQVEGIRAAKEQENYVLTTGTGSGKSLAYIVPIVDFVLRNPSKKGIKAIIVYPMNALANSQMGELEKFLCRGFPAGNPPVTFKRYTGQDEDEARKSIIADPPDILLTNYVMLELVLTRPWDHQLIDAATSLQFLVLDELHTYRGRQGADVAMLTRRVKKACGVKDLIFVGTSATLSSRGTWEDQRKEVAAVASTLFGSLVKPEQVIGETLKRVTQFNDFDKPDALQSLQESLQNYKAKIPKNSDEFKTDPIASWIESTIGVREEPKTGRLVRCTPVPLVGVKGVAQKLSLLTSIEIGVCESAIQQTLLTGYVYKDEKQNPLFAFRLHQFVSKGESVYVSLESEPVRHITLQAQQYVPGSNRTKALFPVAFCRECGQEYYTVRKSLLNSGKFIILPRSVSDRFDNDDGDAGFLYRSSTDPWPDEPDEVMNRLPDAWLEEKNGRITIRKSQRKNMPQKVFVGPDGLEGKNHQVAWWMPAPFRFCLHCQVGYDPHIQSDFGKLATLGSEGRSTATTIMTISSILRLRAEPSLEPKARKLLSFTDNRQDASLQAGHFNDFIEIVLLRSAIWRAVEQAGVEGLRHEKLTYRVFQAMDLPFNLYAVDPTVEYAAKDETNRAFREILGYYIYQDLRRGWRITSPNLEQCGLLGIDYLSLADFCADQDRWATCHPVLTQASMADREKVCRALLDHMRRELAIRVNYLDPVEQEGIRQLSRQRLNPPWSIDDHEKMERGRIIFPQARVKTAKDTGHFLFLSPRGGYGLYLKRPGTFQDWATPITGTDVDQIIQELLELLVIPGLVHRVMPSRNENMRTGYQLNASAMIWRLGTGTCGFHDPVRVPSKPKSGLRTNPFFTEFYKEPKEDLKNLEAREHTAQVPNLIREERENRFKTASLPVLYCSPTMELGVDISQLNVVNMRNIPPTPANYSQRSGRAGRSGQPAFVFSYCTAGSPHDQYFFKRPELMVSGSVKPPRLDIGNEDLIKAHVHAIWLGTSQLSLGKTLSDVLDVSGETPSLSLLSSVHNSLRNRQAIQKTKLAAADALGDAIRHLIEPGDDPDSWLDQVLNQLPDSFNQACNRWRSLYLAALNQSKRQQRVILDPSRDPRDRQSAKRLRAEAEAQLRLLLETGESQHSDFYSYRYFASEGFLPGYNFPRLPLSAFLPGLKKQHGMDEFLTRPRFLAISEFGPRGIIYHEGSRYIINKVILPVDGDEDPIQRRIIQCHSCGYIHPLGDEPGPDLCENCKNKLPLPMNNLFRMQNVATRRRDRINSDEEERLRLGYELKTGLRFAIRDGQVSARTAELFGQDGELLAHLTYGHSATIWRMNLGWRRRKEKDQIGYILDTERGFWSRSQVVEDDPEDPLSNSLKRVVPFVEDRRNCILLQPSSLLSSAEMASLESALKTATQIYFQLEDRELATEPLPDSGNRKNILFYESAEGGAGVLRQFVEDPKTLPEILALALEICHFDPDSGSDKGQAFGARERCEAACYDCLLSYYNQRDHLFLDRQIIQPILMDWKKGRVATSPAPLSREKLFQNLLNLCQSDLERKWIHKINDLGLSLPSHSQKLISACSVRPDFFYQEKSSVIFIDGPHHNDKKQQQKDVEADERLADYGFIVLRFKYDEPWEPILSRFPTLFGKLPILNNESESDPKKIAFDPEDYDESWHSLLQALVQEHGLRVEPGEEVMENHRVVDLDLATVSNLKKSLKLVDKSKPKASQVTRVLEKQGHIVMLISASEDNLKIIIDHLKD